MLTKTKLANGLLLPAALMGIALLVLPAAVRAQTAPFSNTNQGSFSGGFGGGISGYTGGAGGLSGGAGGLSGGAGGLSGGFGLSGGNQNKFLGQLPTMGLSGNQGGYGSGIYGTTGTSSNAAGNAFGRFYTNPQAFGTPTPLPIYGGSLQGGSASGYQGGFGGFGGNPPYGTNNSPPNTPYGPGSNTRRPPTYTAGVGVYRPTGPAAVQRELEQVLARSTSLSPKRDIRVVVDGPAVVLRGKVASDYDRRLAAALIRLSPGVYQVRNELEVPEPTAEP